MGGGGGNVRGKGLNHSVPVYILNPNPPAEGLARVPAKTCPQELSLLSRLVGSGFCGSFQKLFLRALPKPYKPQSLVQKEFL